VAFSLNPTPRDVQDRYQAHKRSGWADIHDRIFQARMAVMGDILPDSVKAALSEDDKPALAYNLHKMYLKEASGQQISTRVDEKVYPTKTGTKDVAAKLTRILKHHSARNHLDIAFSKCFRDLWIGGFAVAENSRVVLDDPIGENQTVCGNPLQHMFDLSHLRPDGRDMADAMKEAYLTAQDLEILLGVPADLAESLVRTSARKDYGIKEYNRQRSLFDTNRSRWDDGARHLAPDLGRAANPEDRAAVIQWTFVRYEPRVFLYDMLTATSHDASRLSVSDIAQMKAQLEANGRPVFVLRQRVRQVYRCIATETEIIIPPYPLGHNRFTDTYGIGYQIGRMLSGEVMDLLDPVLGYSKAMSAITEIVYKTPNTGLITFFDNDLDDEQRAGLKGVASGRSAHVDLPEATRAPVIIQQGQYPSAAFGYAEMHERITKALASSPDSLRGVGTGSHQSGVHAAQMIQQGQIGGQILRDNLLLQRRLCGETNIALWQYYEGPIPFRTYRVIDDERNEEDVQFNIMIGDKILDDLSIGQYDVVVSHSQFSVTDRHQVARTVIESFTAAQIPVPPQLVLELSDDPEAERHFNMVREWEQEQAERQLLALMGKR
jgi:hypothetical protein